jgi:hypothetical protein
LDKTKRRMNDAKTIFNILPEFIISSLSYNPEEAIYIDDQLALKNKTKI